MLIVCPACASEYEIAADRLGTKGRSVRCAACRETWFITPDVVEGADETAERLDEPVEGSDSEPGAPAEIAASTQARVDPSLDDEPVPSPRRRKPAKAPRRVRPKRALSPALAAGLAAFAILPLALLGRSTVVRAMPQTAGLFASVGLPVNLHGVELHDVMAFQTPAQGDKPGELVVEGDLTGVARERVDVPDITVEVRDAHDHPIWSWTIPAPRAALEKAEMARFKASLQAPPAQGRSVQVRFAKAGDAPSGHAEPTAEAKSGAPSDSKAEAGSHPAEAPHPPAHGH